MTELCNCIFFSLALEGRKEKQIRSCFNETVESHSATKAKSNQTALVIRYCSSLHQSMLGPGTPGCTADQLPAGICWEHWEDPLCFCLHTITGFLLFNMHADPLVPCPLSGLGATWCCNVKQGQILQNWDSLSCYGKRFFSFLRGKK